MSFEISRARFSTSRRAFLKAAALGASVAVFDAGPESAAAGENPGFIDVNVSLGHWPARRLPCGDIDQLVAKLRSRRVTQAWAGSLEALLHKDMAAVNAKLAESCRRRGRGLLLPFGSVNPRLPGWEEDLRRCVEVHQFRGIRLYPGYHGYALNEPVFARLLGLAAEQHLVVQLAVAMEDERMVHPLLRVGEVDTKALTDVVRQAPGLKLVLTNALRSIGGEALRELVSTTRVWVEISTLEGVGGLGALLEAVPADRVLFGSHTPLFYFEAAELKLRESVLASDQQRAIRCANAAGLLDSRKRVLDRP